MTDKPATPNPSIMLIVHLSFIMAAIIYVPVTHFFIVPEQDVNSASIPPMVPYILLLIALTHIPLGFIIPGRVIPESALKEQPTAQEFLAKAQVKMVMHDAFFEAPAVIGVVGVIVGMELWMAYGLMLLSILMLAGMISRITGWMDEYRQRERSGR